jgi:hypothetical protein
MIFGRKSDLKSHLSLKRPTWSHKVTAQTIHEQNLETKRQEASPLERDPSFKAEPSEPIQPRF